MARYKTTVTAEIIVDADTPNSALTQVYNALGPQWDVKTKTSARFVQGNGWVKV